MKNFFSFAAGAALGAAVGAAFALLFTPYSGEELQELARESVFARREQLEARLRELRAERPSPSAAEQEV